MTREELELELEDSYRLLWHGATETTKRAARRSIAMLEAELRKELPVTNRIEYTETLVEPTTKEQEILWIANLLAELGQDQTIHNAQAVLSLGLQNAPDKWLLRMAELPALWEKLIPAQV